MAPIPRLGLSGHHSGVHPRRINTTGSCVENLPESRNALVTEDPSGFSPPNSGRGTVQVIYDMNTIEDDVTSCSRSRAYEQQDMA
ncbi:unnamed protein product [Penicillium camemberti]|uniref:Str. FM013 n=1 Tax=Penicillium camemberti (strain FM 013) TaxID=1429867 RepID=A0A0G4NZ18_PENC3|nr:unnamed protein product [Penicillium camemberti]